MAITNGYCTSADLKTFLRITDVTDDAQIDTAVNAASRLIDGACHRRFYAVTETRYYTPKSAVDVLVDDLLSITTLKTDEDGDGVYETVWTSPPDYVLEPFNAPYMSPPGPYWHLVIGPIGRWVFPTSIVQSVQIVGSWGFSATTPDAVKSACIIEAARLFKRNASILGIAGAPELGGFVPAKTSNGIDFDSWALLNGGGFVRWTP